MKEFRLFWSVSSFWNSSHSLQTFLHSFLFPRHHNEQQEMEQLSKLELISKICTTLENHLGFSDKTLAEYIVHLSKDIKDLKTFQKVLMENGADFPQALTENLFRIIQKLSISGNAKPAAGGSKEKLKVVGDDEQSQKFPGLALQNSTPVPLKGMHSEITHHVAPNEKTIDEEFLEDDEAAEENLFDKAKKTDRGKPTEGKTNRDNSRDRGRGERRDDSRERRGKDDRDRGGRDSSRDRSLRDDSREKKRRRDDSRDRNKRDDSRDRDRDRDRNRSEKESSSTSRPSSSKRSSEPEVYGIYDGRVTNILDFGCFVELEGFYPKREGLVHVAQLQQGMVKDIKQVVKRGQKVKVKVISISGTKISLSMKEADQTTGKDLFPERSKETMKNLSTEMRNPSKPLEGGSYYGPSSSNTSQLQSSLRHTGIDLEKLKNEDAGDHQSSANKKKKLSSPELWEARQLINAGILHVSEYPTFDTEGGAGVLQSVETEEVIDIEMNEDEPVFLRGQTKVSKELEPVRIVKNPDGSLSRAAMHQGQLSKERKELKQAQTNNLLDSIPKDLSKPWEDPLPQAGERHFAQELRSINITGNFEMPEWKQKTRQKGISYGFISDRSIKDQRESLPIYRLKSELCQAIAQNQVLVVIGETGSGKTTQMTQYMAEMGYTKLGTIGCTQPRRVAAMSVAKRVAEEYGCNLGEEVGYTIRFEDCTSPQTTIKYMTDGMLMREYLADNNLSKYIAMMLDEAHERTIHTDVLFGLLKNLLKQREDFKLIVTSATLDAEKFSKYFFNCPIFTIPGRTFPVEILYCKEPEDDYLEASLITVMQIHLSEPAGDILLFLTGQEEIDTCAEILFSRMKALGELAPELIILPVYSALPSEMQSRIFEPAPPGARKVVIATNIAEASLTIDGIYYVIDPGFCKQKVFNSKLGMDSLVVCPISQASARQRAGRAGRTGPGKCYRLYTEQAYSNEMLPSSIPEIQRTNLANVVLQLKAMGINDLLHFDFMDPPPVQTLIGALESLFYQAALDEEGLLTKLGRKMAEFPLEPALSKMLIISHELGCSEEILTIVAMLSVEAPFYRPKDKATQADMKKAKFNHADGDHLTLLTVYDAWKASKFSNPWCFENFLQPRAMKRAQDVRKQLVMIMDRYKMDIVSSGKNLMKVRKCIVSGFFTNAAKKDPQEGYKTVLENQPVFIHPSSSLFNKNPEWVIYNELVLTAKEYMRNIIAIDAKWLIELAPNFYKRSDPTKLSKAKRKEKIEPLYDRFNPKDSWRLSKRKG
jgi:ATP-dependent RNA helicase DHX8/PRP22